MRPLADHRDPPAIDFAETGAVADAMLSEPGAGIGI
jgi:hypothetical protein